MLSDAERAATELHLGELIAIRPRKVRGGLAPGQRMPGGVRPGKGRAQSLDFDGISPYAPGDDVRWIEWKSSLRTGQTQMRRFAAESHRARMIVLDLRPDLYFGARHRLMAKSAGLIAAWLGWESVALQEPVGLIIPGLVEIAPRRGRRHLLGVLDAIAVSYQAISEDQAEMPKPIDQVLDDAALSVRTGDEVCVVSDMPTDPAPLAEHARRLATLRRMRFYLVEDQALAAGVAAGRYPVRAPGGERFSPVVPKGAADDAARAAAIRRKALTDAGWDVIPALDILPRGAAST